MTDPTSKPWPKTVRGIDGKLEKVDSTDPRPGLVPCLTCEGGGRLRMTAWAAGGPGLTQPGQLDGFAVRCPQCKGDGYVDPPPPPIKLVRGPDGMPAHAPLSDPRMALWRCSCRDGQVTVVDRRGKPLRVEPCTFCDGVGLQKAPTGPVFSSTDHGPSIATVYADCSDCGCGGTGPAFADSPMCDCDCHDGRGGVRVRSYMASVPHRVFRAAEPVEELRVQAEKPHRVKTVTLYKLRLVALLLILIGAAITALTKGSAR